MDSKRQKMSLKLPRRRGRRPLTLWREKSFETNTEVWIQLRGAFKLNVISPNANKCRAQSPCWNVAISQNASFVPYPWGRPGSEAQATQALHAMHAQVEDEADNEPLFPEPTSRRQSARRLSVSKLGVG
eukprot:586608-Amphidinium_carterae.1